jgi:hypothetical protein
VHADRVPVVGHHIMQLGPEGPGRQLHRPAKEPEDHVGATVVASQRAPARKVPDDLGVEQLTQGVHVPWQRRRSCCLMQGVGRLIAAWFGLSCSS